jgi:serine/threonine protein kinase
VGSAHPTIYLGFGGFWWAVPTLQYLLLFIILTELRIHIMSKCFNPECLNQNFSNDNYCQKCATKLLLKERYRALKIIGEGGFGRTFLAIDQDKPSQPPCVIKQFLPQAQGTTNIEKAAQLFAEEAIRLDELGKHPQIPELFAYFIQDNRQYLVQEFINGKNLQQELNSEGNFNEQKIKELLIDILTVLKYVHENKVIHRDIKPENIIRREGDNKLILVDFGASKILENTPLTVTGTIIGSAQYAAPEQVLGRPQYNSDLYSLGVTCLYLLTGINPFDLFDSGEGDWVWRDYLGDNLVSNELGIILDKLVQIGYKKRYQSVNEILNDCNFSSLNHSISPLTNKKITESEITSQKDTPQKDTSQKGLTEFYPLNGLLERIITEDIDNKIVFPKNQKTLTKNSLKYIQKLAKNSLNLGDIILRYHHDHKCSEEEAEQLAIELRELTREILMIHFVSDLERMFQIIPIFVYQISRFKHSGEKYCWDTYMKKEILKLLNDCILENKLT